jgi:hypothetical protein
MLNYYDKIFKGKINNLSSTKNYSNLKEETLKKRKWTQTGGVFLAVMTRQCRNL